MAVAVAAVVNAIKGAEPFPCNGHSPIDGPDSRRQYCS